MHTKRNLMKRALTSVLLAGAIGTGAVATTAAPAQAATFQQCAKAAKWGGMAAWYAQNETGNFWYVEWSYNEAWMGANC